MAHSTFAAAIADGLTRRKRRAPYLPPPSATTARRTGKCLRKAVRTGVVLQQCARSLAVPCRFRQNGTPHIPPPPRARRQRRRKTASTTRRIPVLERDDAPFRGATARLKRKCDTRRFCLCFPLSVQVFSLSMSSIATSCTPPSRTSSTRAQARFTIAVSCDENSTVPPPAAKSCIMPTVSS